MIDFAPDVLPAGARRLRFRRRVALLDPAPWLLPPARRHVYQQLVDDYTSEPWDWRSARWHSVNTRLLAIGERSHHEIARSEGFSVATPLLAPDFIGAVCRAGGRLGWTTRTEAMRTLAGDLLPEAVLSRSSKATFGGAYMSDHVREFARRWDGAGVDHDLVDVGRLRAEWLTELPSTASMLPLVFAMHADRASGR